MQGTLRAIDRVAGAVFREELHGALGEQATDFAAAAFLAGNDHGVVAGRLMAQPRDGGGFGALLEGDALRAGDGAAADGGGVLGDEIREGRGFAFEGGMECEEADDGVTEVGGVILFVGGAALPTGVKLPLIRRVGALEDERGTQGLDPRGGCPDAAGETFAALDLDHRQRGTVLLDPPTERGVAGREQSPIVGDGFEDAVFVEDVAGVRTGTDFAGERRHG